SGISSSDDVAIDVFQEDHVYGENNLAVILEDSFRELFACQTKKVILKDFQLYHFSGTGDTPVNSGVRTTSGSFTSYGHYQAEPDSPDTNEKKGYASQTIADIKMTTNFMSMRHE
ncbi:MAG: hypothetical protein WD025_08375, partial [Bacteriovoracaceae bacterium]